MKYYLALITLLFLTSCGTEAPADLSGEKQVIEEDPEEVSRLVDEYLKDKLSNADTGAGFRVNGDTLVAFQQTLQFYTENQFKAGWTGRGSLNTGGDSLLSVFRRAETFGLIPDDYHVSTLDSLLSTSYDSINKSYNVNKLAQADLLLTDAFFTFAVHVSVGRMENDSAVTRSWRIARMDTNLNLLLNEARKTHNYTLFFESLEPQRREYQAVKKYMNHYRDSLKKAGITWDRLPDRKTDSTGFLSQMKEHLILWGDWDTTWTEKDSLQRAKALKRFQKRNHLEQDGKLGRNTLMALNMTPEDWCRQFAMNMERWRWEPEKFEKRHMIVNLPAFKMTVWEEDTIVMESRIVCGAVKTPTPQLNSKMYQIVLYPYWNVPYSIAWKEILPQVKRDTGYLRKHRYEVLDRNNKVVDPKTINWKKYGKGNLPYKFRQMTGDDNALGIMKFEFHNPHSVYMHDTNAKKYFKTETRAYSHGCMRLEKFMELAYFLIREDSVKLPKDTFDVWVKQDTQRKIAVRKPLPIHVRYFTCEVDTNSNVTVHTDIYLRDDRMMRMLYGLPSNDLEEKDKKNPAAEGEKKKEAAIIEERKRRMI